jgi:hypothetical protein
MIVHGVEVVTESSMAKPPPQMMFSLRMAAFHSGRSVPENGC